MKFSLTILSACGLFAVSAYADDKQSTQKAAVKLPSMAKVIEVKTPFENPWAASSWEEGSGENFWHATSTEPQSLTGPQRERSN
ncbi:MAG: hypothetical protein P1U89_27450 [Verrucomicrobiales bacterium]|nr:hypothetical protein [Verrucomicrobiales bacterium]